MSATEELRRLLGERGVEYRAIGDATFWETHDGAFRYKAESHAEKLMVMTCCSQKCTVMTPEQAIAATLGSTYEPPLACHWDGDVLVLTVPRDPSSIHVQRAEGQPRKVYSGEPELVSTHAVIVSDESTDCATGHCECELCGKPIDIWDKFCRHCGAKVLQPVVMGKGER